MQATSKEAYEQIKADGTEAHHEQKILRALGQLKQGGTFLDIAGMTDIAYLQVARRCAKLVKDKKIKDSGIKSKSSPSRKSAIVWELAGAESSKSEENRQSIPLPQPSRIQNYLFN